MAIIRRAGPADGRSRILIGALLTVTGLLAPCGAARAAEPFATLYRFPASGKAGSTPVADLVADSSGVLYGTTPDGGKGGLGTVFSLTPPTPPGSKWTERVLHSFTGGPSDGANPAGALWFEAGTNTLYGTTLYGGKGSCTSAEGSGCGTVFALTAPAAPAGRWTENVLYSFLGDDDGANPSGMLALNAGVLYGTTRSGGVAPFCTGCGTVFALPLGGEESAIYTFGTVEGDGANPNSGVVVGAVSPQIMLYGTTTNGGTTGGKCGIAGCGTVFGLTQGTSAWSENGRQSFDFSNGANPYAGLTIGGGVLYGTTYAGGKGACAANDPEAVPGCGTIFQVQVHTTGGGLGEAQTLYSFKGGADGANPYAGVSFGPDETGVLYGTAVLGGKYADGTLFQLTLGGGILVLHPFTGGTGGSNPIGGVIFGNDGNLYGTTAGAAIPPGGAATRDWAADSNDGTAFSLQCTKVPQCCGKGC